MPNIGPCLPGWFLSLVAFVVPICAQVPSRLVIAPVDESKLTTLRGNVHPQAEARYDLGSVGATTPTGRLLLLLNRPTDQEAALDRYLNDLHSRNSAIYHQWIAPQQFGARFGPADSDIQVVSGWLRTNGFQVTRVSESKTLLEFSGVVGQVNQAFHTQIHRYEVNGELHYANATDPQIPEALAGIIGGISSLHDFRAKPAIRLVGRARLDPETKKITPEDTLAGPNGTFYGVSPEDFATEYDLAPLYAAGINGSGKTIGIINDSNIDLSLDTAYRSLFGVSGNPPQIVVDGGDPGVNADELEAYLDVEVAGAVAPNATVNLYIASVDTLDDPLILAAQRAIEDNQADVLSISFGNCEANLGTSDNQILSALWQQAAAQGQTVLVSSGDNGSDGCDNPSGHAASVSGFGVNGFASTPWDVAVGGTDFYYSDYATGATSAATLWNATNDANYGSLKASLPEQVWNDWFGFNAIPSTTDQTIYAGSGGVSAIYSKPAWQTGSSVPNDSHRDLPDISLFAGAGANLSGYVICANPGDCTPESGGLIPVSIVGGTSASAQAMAGIMALIDQKHGRQGQANFVLYPLAQQIPSAFHDITLGGNNVPCVQGTPDCVLGTSGTDNEQYTLSGYPAGTGYDLASGLGSLDANELVTNWNKIAFLPTITTLQLSSSTFTHGTAVAFTADVTHASGSESPTGKVAILTNSPVPFGQTQNVLPIGSNGSATGSVDALPGGNYQLWASYAGDGIYSGGTSSPVAVTVTPENSSVSIAAMQMTATGNRAVWCFPFVGPSETPLASGSTVSPGNTLWLTVQPKGAVSGLTTATGSVSFTIDSQPAVSVPLNVKGVATWTTPANATAGTHSVAASYSGDVSYNASRSNPFVYSVEQGEFSISITPGGICGSGTTCMAYAGDTVPVEIYMVSTGCLAPTGTVTVTLGSQSQTVTMSQEGLFVQPTLTGIAEFSNLTSWNVCALCHLQRRQQLSGSINKRTLRRGVRSNRSARCHDDDDHRVCTHRVLSCRRKHFFYSYRERGNRRNWPSDRCCFRQRQWIRGNDNHPCAIWSQHRVWEFRPADRGLLQFRPEPDYRCLYRRQHVSGIRQHPHYSHGRRSRHDSRFHHRPCHAAVRRAQRRLGQYVHQSSLDLWLQQRGGRLLHNFIYSDWLQRGAHLGSGQRKRRGHSHREFRRHGGYVWCHALDEPIYIVACDDSTTRLLCCCGLLLKSEPPPGASRGDDNFDPLIRGLRWRRTKYATHHAASSAASESAHHLHCGSERYSKRSHPQCHGDRLCAMSGRLGSMLRKCRLRFVHSGLAAQDSRLKTKRVPRWCKVHSSRPVARV